MEPETPGEGPKSGVSVIIPSLDCRSTIIEQLRAVCAQQADLPFDVLVADNGSDDGTAEIIEAHLAQHGHGRARSVEVIDASSRRGSAHARNVGAAAARGEWLAFCDADDVVAPGWLDALLQRAEPSRIIGGALRVERLNPSAALRARSSRPADSLNTAAGFLPFVPTGNMLVHASLFDALGGLNEDYLRSHDVEFSWRAQLAGYTVGFAPSAVVDYRYRPTTSSAFLQAVRSGRANAQLYVDFRRHGLRQRRFTATLSDWGWMAIRVPYVVTPRRALWIRKFGEAWGRLLGSVRWRVLYL